MRHVMICIMVHIMCELVYNDIQQDSILCIANILDILLSQKVYQTYIKVSHR